MRVFVGTVHPQSTISRKEGIMKDGQVVIEDLHTGAIWNGSGLGSHRFISRTVVGKTR